MKQFSYLVLMTLALGCQQAAAPPQASDDAGPVANTSSAAGETRLVSLSLPGMT